MWCDRRKVGVASTCIANPTSRSEAHEEIVSFASTRGGMRICLGLRSGSGRHAGERSGGDHHPVEFQYGHRRQQCSDAVDRHRLGHARRHERRCEQRGHPGRRAETRRPPTRAFRTTPGGCAAATSNGWSGTTQLLSGAQFNVSTAGASNIVASFDVQATDGSPRHGQFQYTVDGANFTSFGSLIDFNASYDGWATFSYDLSVDPGGEQQPAVRVQAGLGVLAGRVHQRQRRATGEHRVPAGQRHHAGLQRHGRQLAVRHGHGFVRAGAVDDARRARWRRWGSWSPDRVAVSDRLRASVR